MRKAIFLDRDGVIVDDVDYLVKPEQIRLIPGAAAAIRAINGSEYLAIVVTNQSAVARNLCSIDDVESVHRSLGHMLALEEAKLDGVYYCPHHPGGPDFSGGNDAFIRRCDCRKPNTGLILRAMAEFSIDVEASCIIGDSGRDIECGLRAGLTTIAVRTGNGCKSSGPTPDYFFDDVGEAVRFVVTDPLQGSFEQISRLIEKVSGHPVIIVIDGPRRSGKTTLSRYLRRRLSVLGHDVSIHDRGLEISVLRPDQSSSSLSTITQSHTAEGSEGPAVTKNIVLIESSGIFGDEELRDMADILLYCDCDKAESNRRNLSHLRWLGCTADEIAPLIHAFTQENDHIQRNRHRAHLVIR